MKIYEWKGLTPAEKRQVLARPVAASQAKIRTEVQEFINAVRQGGDACLRELTYQYDRVRLNDFAVREEEIEKAFKVLDLQKQQSLKFVIQQLKTVHEAQQPQVQSLEVCAGVFCERQARAIERVGLYVPGGTAPLVSSLLMLAVPASLAGCRLRVLCTPPNRQGEIDPALLVAASLCGIEKIYKVGGAQAIAAMAYGTETIPKVDKIFGPGNAWVTQAKLMLAQDPEAADMDLPAGPSEVLIIADKQANLEFIAADLLSQAEHGPDSQVLLVTDAPKIADALTQTLEKQLLSLPRAAVIRQALENSRIIVVKDLEEALAVSNDYAPEHLILQVAEAEQYKPLIENAGAVFLGAWSPVAAGDYVTGSNHVLPTNGYARTISGLSLNDFIKYISFQRLTPRGLEKIGPHGENVAALEGLTAHQQSIALRLAEITQTNNLVRSSNNEYN